MQRFRATAFAALGAATLLWLAGPGTGQTPDSLMATVEALERDLDRYTTAESWKRHLEIAELKRLAAMTAAERDQSVREKLEGLFKKFEDVNREAKYRFLSERTAFQKAHATLKQALHASQNERVKLKPSGSQSSSSGRVKLAPQSDTSRRSQSLGSKTLKLKPQPKQAGAMKSQQQRVALRPSGTGPTPDQVLAAMKALELDLDRYTTAESWKRHLEIAELKRLAAMTAAERDQAVREKLEGLFKKFEDVNREAKYRFLAERTAFQKAHATLKQALHASQNERVKLKPSGSQSSSSGTVKLAPQSEPSRRSQSLGSKTLKLKPQPKPASTMKSQQQRARLKQQSATAVQLAGQWNSNIGLVYDIQQRGSTFSWTVHGNSQRGNGKLSGSTVKASWTGGGSATGRITGKRGNVATRIEWSNGVLFYRTASR